MRRGKAEQSALKGLVEGGVAITSPATHEALAAPRR
jgi:hypothetical protein